MTEKEKIIEDYLDASNKLRIAQDRFIDKSQKLVFYLQDMAAQYDMNAAKTPAEGSTVTAVLEED